MNHRTLINLLFAAALACLAIAPAAHGEVTEEWGVDRRGGDYRNFRAADLAQCQEACEADRSCRAYTFTVGANTCYLKSGPGSAQRRDGRVSGVKVGAAAAPSQGYAGGALTEEWGYDYAGNDYRTFQASTLAECKVTCREEDRCRAYTFNLRSQTCYLKEATGPRQAGPNHVTGTKESGYAAPAASNLTEERGYDYPSSDYYSFKAEDLEVCKQTCREEQRCRAYSFNPRSGLCYLKERTGGREANANTVAGTKDRTAPPPPAAGQPATGAPSAELTEEWGYDYRGNDYRSFRARGHEPCRLTCQREDRCRAYTFNQSTEMCYLKNATGYRDPNRDTVTGTKDH